MWYLNNDYKINLSVGYDTILKVEISPIYNSNNGILG